MPLTNFQIELAKLLAVNRSAESHLAGGAALHFAPNSVRFSNDLDLFHDTTEKVSDAFQGDSALLEKHGYKVEVEMRQPGYIRAIVAKGKNLTKIEWAYDSAWRFMPPIENSTTGFQLHPIDLAVNKALALAGRDEARDFLDILFVHEKVLSLGALCWAAVGKDPGFTPLSLLELMKRRGKYQPEDFTRLMLTKAVDIQALKVTWLKALEQADDFIRTRPADEAGCLYYSKKSKRFVAPEIDEKEVGKSIVPHYGCLGGILPKFFQGDTLADEISLMAPLA